MTVSPRWCVPRGWARCTTAICSCLSVEGGIDAKSSYGTEADSSSITSVWSEVDSNCRRSRRELGASRWTARLEPAAPHLQRGRRAANAAPSSARRARLRGRLPRSRLCSRERRLTARLAYRRPRLRVGRLVVEAFAHSQPQILLIPDASCGSHDASADNQGPHVLRRTDTRRRNAAEERPTRGGYHPCDALRPPTVTWSLDRIHRESALTVRTSSRALPTPDRFARGETASLVGRTS